VSINKLLSIVAALMMASCAQQSLNQKEKAVVLPESSLLRHLQFLSSDHLQGRKIGSPGSKLAQNYLVEQLAKADIQPLGKHYLAPFSIDGIFSAVQGNNVIAMIPGSTYPDKFIVLSAHFDHIGGQGRKIYNGADDNASGTSALLHYAKLLKQSPLRYSVILLFTDGEEANLKGAYAFVQQNDELLNRIILNINVDMIAGNKRTKRLRYISRGLDTLLSTEQLTAYSSQQQQAAIKIKKGFRKAGRGHGNNIKWEVASDHGAFYRHDIPFIYFGVGSHNNYHQTSDTYENVNHQFFINAVDTIYQQLTFLDQNL
jgi:Zn-dependent M28 family amino/carboxypeptidase